MYIHNIVHVKRSISPTSPTPQPVGGSAAREPCGSHASLGDWQLSVAAGGVARLGIFRSNRLDETNEVGCKTRNLYST